MGAKVPAPPPPSPEERRLQRIHSEILEENRDLARIQYRQMSALAPFFFEELGLKPQYGDQEHPLFGREIVGYERIPDEVRDPLSPLRKEIEQSLLERSRAALRGELPVSPGLERDLQRQEETLRETLLRQLGPGYATSSPGIRSLAEFEAQKQIILDAARRGELSLSEQLSQARASHTLGLQTGRAGLFQAPYLTASELAGSAMGRAGTMVGQGLDYYLRDRGMLAQYNLERARQSSETIGMIAKGAGLVAGSILGVVTGGAGFGALGSIIGGLGSTLGNVFGGLFGGGRSAMPRPMTVYDTWRV